MASMTRAVEIFQDPTPATTNFSMHPETASNSTCILNTVRPSPYTLDSTSIIFAPPFTAVKGRSPLKAVTQAKKSPLKGLCTTIALPPPDVDIFTTDSPGKALSVSSFRALEPQKPNKASLASSTYPKPLDKENFPPVFSEDVSPEVSHLAHKPVNLSKRKLPDAGQVQDRQGKKPRLEPKHETRSAPVLEEQATLQLPEPRDMPQIEDNGSKPPYSYALLIGMSILRSPNRRLTLAQIYRWISDSFSHYRATDLGWQNSIRHNLSLNKAFVKQERPKDDPGKGNYWAIKPGMEGQFLKDKPNRRVSSSFGSNLGIFAQSSIEGNSSVIMSPRALPRGSTSAGKTDAQLSDIFLLSSDATIPASAISIEDEFHETINMPPPSSRAPLSSPLQTIHSSPPVAPHFHNTDTSPRLDFPLPPSRPCSRRRNLGTGDDSGYFSALNSSAARSQQPGNNSFTEIGGDKKRMRRGRAEIEIARIRSLSHDVSPTKGRHSLHLPTTQLLSSSPLPHFGASSMLPPLTPAVKFQIPPNPPASISPNTNLRNHRNKIRELVGSPVKNTGLLHDEIPFSPAFNILEDQQCSPSQELLSGFEILAYKPTDPYLHHPPISLKKRSIPRNRLGQANNTARILADVMGTSLNRKAMASTPNLPIFDSPSLKKSGRLPSRYNEDVEKEDIFRLNLCHEEDPDEFCGLDILQGFQKIGGNKNIYLTPTKSSKQSSGPRNHVSRFQAP